MQQDFGTTVFEYQSMNLFKDKCHGRIHLCIMRYLCVGYYVQNLNIYDYAPSDHKVAIKCQRGGASDKPCPTLLDAKYATGHRFNIKSHRSHHKLHGKELIEHPCFPGLNWREHIKPYGNL